MGLTASKSWVLMSLAVLTACGSRPAPQRVVVTEPPRDTVVRVERVSGLSFITPVGIDTVIAVPSELELYVGDSLMTGTVRVMGRDSMGADITIPVPFYAFAQHDVAELRGGFIRALRPGQATLFVLYDRALWREPERVPPTGVPFAQVSVLVRSRH